jgi:hypothetical protein
MSQRGKDKKDKTDHKLSLEKPFEIVFDIFGVFVSRNETLIIKAYPNLAYPSLLGIPKSTQAHPSLLGLPKPTCPSILSKYLHKIF